MKAQIVYDKPCRIRFRCGSNAFTKELERSIHKLVMSNPWAIACEAHYENGGILIRYKEDHRAEAVELVRKLRGSYLAPVSDNQYDTEEIDRTFKSDLAKLVMQRYIRKAILPAPIGAALIVYSGLKYIAKGVSALFDGKLTVEVLDGASISACLIQKNYNTAGTVMFLLSVSGLLEDYTRARTRAALTDSLAIKADQVWLAGKDADTLIPMSQLQVDDCIRVRTGSVIPVDGQITEGEAYINEASMTGEPLAVMKSAGASVFAGTVVEEGSVVIKVRKLSSDTKISKIIELIDNSENLKAGVQSKAERLADSIVPYSFLAFGLTLLFTRNVTKAVSVLMVDYSCAIKLSTPIAVISAIKEAADDDVTVKGGKYLEAVADASTIVFDKTGTLTKGVFAVKGVYSVIDKNELIKYAAYAEFYSTHPIAVSVKNAYKNTVDTAKILNYTEISGMGISADIDGHKVLAGNGRLLESNNISHEKAKSHIGSIIYIAVDGKFAGYIVISDEIKADSKAAISALKQLNIKSVMLTGDIKKNADYTAEQIGIDKVYSQLLPQDKVSKLEEILSSKNPKKNVAFVGDGINDAPVLMRSDVGIAMGGIGSDSAIEAADVVLMTDEPSKIAKASKISAKTMSVILQNIVFAIGVKVLVMILSVLGISTMWLAIFADVGVSLLAILNSLRALYYKD